LSFVRRRKRKVFQEGKKRDRRGERRRERREKEVTRRAGWLAARVYLLSL